MTIEMNTTANIYTILHSPSGTSVNIFSLLVIIISVNQVYSFCVKEQQVTIEMNTTANIYTICAIKYTGFRTNKNGVRSKVSFCFTDKVSLEKVQWINSVS